MKLCNQLQDTTEIDPVTSGQVILSSIKDGETDLLLFDYVTVLALDYKSILPLHELLKYLHSKGTNSHANSSIVTFVSRRLDQWSIPPTSTGAAKMLLTALRDYMKCLKDNKDRIIEARALTYFILRLCQSGHESVFLGGDDSSGYRATFRTMAGQFLSYLDSSDTLASGKMVSEIYASYGMILGEGSDSTTVKQHKRSAVVADTFVLSRAFRLVWLEHVMFCSGRIQNDSFMIELQPFLKHESNKDVIKDLVITSFDCYAVCLLRKDSPKYQSLWKGFIVKRLPLVIKALAGQSGKIDMAICQPITLLDRGTVNLLRISGGGDALDEMFSSFPSTTSDIRHDFLQACVDLGLIDAESVKKTLGTEASSALEANSMLQGRPGSDFVLDPATGQEVSIDGVFLTAAQEDPEYVSFDESTIVRLVTIFEDLDGVRQEKVAKKILQVVQEWVSQQMSRCLRRMCQAIALKTNSLDALLLHIQPIQLLSPLVRYLDNWKEDEDEINFQDMFTDFGSILLLVVLVYRRYDLGLEDLGISTYQDSFCSSAVRQLQKTSSWQATSLEDLSTDQRDLLGGWITGLFDTDGISDELMRSCSAKDLVNLAPLIFQQAVTACSKGVIDFDALRGGLEYFVQPFMLGALLGAFKYLYTSLWSAQQDSAVTLKVIHGLVLPSDISGEAMNLHRIVLSIAADDIMDALSEFKTDDATTISAITSGLSPYLSGNPTPMNPATVSLIAAIKDHIYSLVNWLQALDQGQVTGPPGYSKSIISLAVDILGSRTVLKILLDELDLSETQGTFNYTLDVLSSLIVVMDTVPSDQNNYKPRQNKLDSCLLRLLTDEPEESIGFLRPERPKEKRLTGYRVLKERVDGLLKQTNSVPIWEKLHLITEIPAVTPLQNNSQPQPTQTNGIDDFTNDDYSNALLDIGDVNIPDDGLFGDDMMMDLT